MKKPSISDKIIGQLRIKYMQRGLEWYSGGDLEIKLAGMFGCKAGTINRELRRLTEENNGERLEKDERECLYSKIKTVWYRYKPSKYDIINKSMS